MGNKMSPRVIIGASLVALAVLFIIQNVAIVEIQFLFWSIRMSRSLLVLVLLAIGAAMGWILRGYVKRHKK